MLSPSPKCSSAAKMRSLHRIFKPTIENCGVARVRDRNDEGSRRARLMAPEGDVQEVVLIGDSVLWAFNGVVNTFECAVCTP